MDLEHYLTNVIFVRMVFISREMSVCSVILSVPPVNIMMITVVAVYKEWLEEVINV